MGETWNKREREQRKRNAKKQKEEKKQERKENSGKVKSLDDMLAYVDEYGNLSETPPDRRSTASDYIPPVVANTRELNAGDPTRTGVITFYDSNKGYGFIKDSVSGESVFVHINSASVQLKEQLKVAFELQKGPKGMVAVNVTAA
ncbi:cold-shock protein [Niabella drilacis]|uniref:Cold-shock DNA-binding protein family n=1 Tax=Niabella drilacis (strain DSM 25811 / CCM 8410 / CCUG 62505 / LMG 26954 / E90) TaxID=1285928 RepID=A0A1G6PLB1_NIADE|nr:cold shock domain-containing protein [Niabella drilacis]SDC80197.1 cold-shock DNA-binding protein family [Niabella drilacis]